MQILTTETYTSLDGLGLLAGFIGICLIAFGLVIALEAFTDGEPFMMGVGGFVMVVGIIVAYFLHDIDAKDYVKHQVIITDITMVVEGGYEIVDMDGRLATIKKPLGEVSE